MNENKQTIFNFFSGFFTQMILVVLGFVIPRIVLTHYGSDTNGLINTITQIFSYVALLEAGIGQAAQNALYPFLKTEDQNGISVIMSIARRYYRKIAVVYAAIVLILSCVIPVVLKTQIDYLTIFLFVLFEGLTSLVGFYFTANWVYLLNADGKIYITNLVALLVRILSYGVKIVLALYGVNIAFLQIGYFAISIVSLSIYSCYMRKYYNWIDYRAASKDQVLPYRNSYVITELASTIFSSTDMIVLSIFVSTALSSVYSTYNMVFIAFESLINGAYNGIKYLLGRTYQEGIERYCTIHDVFNSFFMGCITTVVCVSYWLLLPFVKLYTNGVTDINYTFEWLPLCFCMVAILSRSRSIAGNLSGIAGYAKKVSIISLIEAITNVVLSVILVQFWGIYGVIFATVIALPVKVVYVNYLADHTIMQRKPCKTLSILGSNYLIFAVTVILNNYFKLRIETYYSFAVYGAILTAIYFVLVFGINTLSNKDMLSIRKLISR